MAFWRSSVELMMSSYLSGVGGFLLFHISSILLSRRMSVWKTLSNTRWANPSVPADAKIALSACASCANAASSLANIDESWFL